MHRRSMTLAILLAVGLVLGAPSLPRALANHETPEDGLALTLEGPETAVQGFRLPFTGTLSLEGEGLPDQGVVIETRQPGGDWSWTGYSSTDWAGRFAVPDLFAKTEGPWEFRAVWVGPAPKADTALILYQADLEPLAQSRTLEVEVRDPSPWTIPEGEIDLRLQGYDAYKHDGQVEVWMHLFVQENANVDRYESLEGRAEMDYSNRCWPGQQRICYDGVGPRRQLFSASWDEDSVAAVSVGPFTWAADESTHACNDLIEVDAVAWDRTEDGTLLAAGDRDSPEICV